MDFDFEKNDMQASYFDNSNEDFLKIKIFGVGGGGCNAVYRLREKVDAGVEFIASNTDMMALSKINYPNIKKLQLGKEKTKGMGAGALPEVGKEAARESREEIKKMIDGANMVFVTAGMGGGTGTGGAPVVAGVAKELGILTIGIVTKPFNYEGKKKMVIAEEGIERLKKEVDVLIVVPNERAFEYAPTGTPLIEVVKMADDVLLKSIMGITDIMLKHSLINLDFADIRTVIKNKGTAHIGVGRAQGENRVMDALRKACSSPLLDSNIEGATHIIVSVVADYELSGNSVEKALNLIPEVAAPDANIIHGLGFDENLKDEVVVTVIATGFEGGNDNTMEVSSVETNVSDDKPSLFSIRKKPQVKVENEPEEVKQDDIPAFLQRLKQRG